MNDLITLAQATSWLKLPITTPDAAFIQSLVDGASQEFLTQTSRNAIALATYSERRNGTGTDRITLVNRPVQSITSLAISNVTIQASADGVRPGYVNDDVGIQLVGGWTGATSFPTTMPMVAPGRFWKGVGNVFVTYTAGYPNNQVGPEAHTVPATPYQFSLGNASTYVEGSLSISYQSSGLALEAVTGVPAVGQYVIAATGVATCAAADVGAVLLCDYQTIGIPADIQKCVFEMVGWAYKGRDRIGMQSERFADNLSVSYSQMPFSPMSQRTIDRYTRKDIPTW